MGDSSPAESARVKGKTIIKPIVFGNESKYFGKKRESDGHTHSWTVYVKPYEENEDISVYIKKVIALIYLKPNYLRQDLCLHCKFFTVCF